MEIMKHTEIVNKIVSKKGLDYDTEVHKAFGSKPKVLLGNLISCVLDAEDLNEASKNLGISKRTLERIMPKVFPECKVSKPWHLKLKEFINLKTCNSCKETKELENFGKVKTRQGYSSICKDCDNKRSKAKRVENPEKQRAIGRNHYYSNKEDYIARNANRRASLKQRTPKWADLEKIKSIYQERPEGFHVDHIIPLQGGKVSGLHVPENLQYLKAEDNIKKSNKFKV